MNDEPLPDAPAIPTGDTAATAPAVTDTTPAATGGRAAARRAREAEAAASSTSRSERRRIELEQQKKAKSRYALWKAWWLYPLIAAIGFLVYQGIQSAADAPPPAPAVSTLVPSP